MGVCSQLSWNVILFVAMDHYISVKFFLTHESEEITSMPGQKMHLVGVLAEWASFRPCLLISELILRRSQMFRQADGRDIGWERFPTRPVAS